MHRRAALPLLLALLAPCAAQAEGRRVALVIANSQYQHIDALRNPLADAQAVAERLKRAGFALLHPLRREDVQADLTWEQMAQADKALEQAAAGAEMALLFYTGHGVQIDGVPYLVPVELPRPTAESLKSEGGKEILKHGLVELDKLLDGLDEHAGLAVAIFDACREIPQFRQASKAVFGDDAPYRGLVRPKNSGRHRILAYSASSGELALDGEGRPHSPYVQTWLDEFDRKAGQEDLIAFFNGVAAQVTDSRGQNPEVVSSGVMPGSFYFQTPAAPPKPELPDLAAVEQGVWDIIQDSDKPADFAKYLRQCQQGRFPCPNAEEARRRLDALKDAQRGQAEADKVPPSVTPLIQAPLPPPATDPDNRLNAAPAVPARAKPATGKPDFGIEMVSLPGGMFQMGCGPKDGKCEDDEKPRHEVTVRPFAIAKTEVTQGQWQAVMGSNPSNFKNCGDDCPVESVSWNDVQTFIAKLNRTSGGGGFRLPSEAEWEYACKAGQDTLYCGGDNLDQVAWYGYAKAGATTHPVKSKQPNAFGLYDMSGNVFEWVQDCYHDSYQGSPRNGSVWEDGVACSSNRRGIRGGSWGGNSEYLCSASRFMDGPSGAIGDLGFRLANAVKSNRVTR